jgi:hypothetical protein
LPAAAWRAVFSWPVLFAVVGAFLCGLALTWILSSPLRAPPGHEGPAPAAIAASFLLNLALLGTVLALLPLDSETWGGLCTWLRGVVLAGAAFAGWAAAPGSQADWTCAVALAALTAAQAAALCGLAGLVAAIFGRHRRVARMGLAVVWVLAVTGLFWSKPVLEALQRHSPRTYEAATQALVAVGPVTGVAALWNEAQPGFSLVKSRYTYELWIGANLPYFPRLWPGRGDQPGLPSGGAWPPGLGLSLLLVGLVLTVAGDYLGFVRRPAAASAA